MLPFESSDSPVRRERSRSAVWTALLFAFGVTCLLVVFYARAAGS